MVARFGNANLSITVLPSITGIARGLSRTAGELRTFGSRHTDGPLPRAVDDIITPSIDENFATRSNNGVGWQSWHPETPFMPYHRQYGPARGILEVTGRLRDRATQKGIWQFRGQQGEAFVPASMMPAYAMIHQEGGVNQGLDGNRGYIVARPFMDISDDDIGRIQEIFQDWIGDVFGKNVASGASVESVVGSSISVGP